MGANTKSKILASLIVIAFVGLSPVFGQKGTLTRISVHAKSLENTVTKENPDRAVSIYLPPGYESSSTKRYPVVYFLHGIGDTDQSYTEEWSLPNGDEMPFSSISTIMDEGIRRGRFGEMIVVLPDEKSNWLGSYYVNSSVTGNWADFTAKELVAYVDNNYRTIAKPEQRGIAGHSMGGYGAITLGMKHPEVFSVVYGLNPALMSWGGDLTIETPAFTNILKAKSFQDLIDGIEDGDFYTAAIVTVAQAFSPNPDKPPFYCDFPFEMSAGQLRPSEPAFSKWEENSPVNMVKDYRSNLLKLRALRFDSGYSDEFKFIPPNTREFSLELTNNGIPHIFEEYNGDHRNRLPGRNGRMITEVFPYFWDYLNPVLPGGN